MSSYVTYSSLKPISEITYTLNISATSSLFTTLLAPSHNIIWLPLRNVWSETKRRCITPNIYFNPVSACTHDDVIKWKHFPRYWSFVRGIHLSPLNSPHKGQRRGALMYSLICASINDWVNTREAGDFRRHRAHYDVIVMNRFNIFAVDFFLSDTTQFSWRPFISQNCLPKNQNLFVHIIRQ